MDTAGSMESGGCGEGEERAEEEDQDLENCGLRIAGIRDPQFVIADRGRRAASSRELPPQDAQATRLLPWRLADPD